ncbi:cytochrome oxidase assembly protein ShyY1 [Labedaea rhizosphaerae]|uniref:SURF1-like protein n=1 Tax=Labedaea rhizosphaerae TaxID=598644 RepID=A0A4R6SKM3_LABRH|nr:cytochrome oxidase assembly protein ShyY1 [Labedaea rhizosphaerae]
MTRRTAYRGHVRLRLLLRPSWLALTLVVLVFAGACFVVLSPWQFRRNAEQSAQNAELQASFTAKPVPIETARPGEWRQVILRGQYLPDKETVARLRTVQGEPAFEVLTPFRLDSGGVVLVDRGYVPPVQGVHVPPYPAAPAGPTSVTARTRAGETDPQHRPAFNDATTDGRTQVYAIDVPIVAAATKLPLAPGYVQLVDGQPGGLRTLPLPQLDSGPYLSYALQWIAFGTMALLALGYFSWREIQPGGALAEPRPDKPKRRSVAAMIAEDEAAERHEHAHQP